MVWNGYRGRVRGVGGILFWIRIKLYGGVISFVWRVCVGYLVGGVVIS